MPTTPPAHDDDSQMDRFDRWSTRRFSAREAIASIAIAAILLIAAAGTSIRKAGEEMNPGIGRDLVLAVGKPAAWISEKLPVKSVAHTLTAWLSPDQSLSGGGSFVGLTNAQSSAVPPVTPDAFDPAQIGAPEPKRRKLHTLLVTGDSMAEPLDLYLARTLDPQGVNVIRDPHVGTGISNPILVDWGRLSEQQVAANHPDAVVVFIGANDGYSMPGPGGRQVDCCGSEWAAIYATRARAMMNTYRQNGSARVYWLTLPTPRDRARAPIARVVNAAIAVAAEPWQDQIRIIDTVPVFTPGNRYRDSMVINGTPTIVRESDGIHLNDPGSSYAAKLVLGVVGGDFTF
jgi:lysophospholipase L1-like esterase